MAAIDSLVNVAYDVEALRNQQFPIARDTTYLNHAGISPIPQRTYEALTEADRRLLMDPAGSFDPWFMDKQAAFNTAFRDLVNARRVEEIVGITSTSFALNLVAQSLTWQRGQNVVLCDVEFPSNVYPWMRLQEQYGIDVRLVPSDSGGLTVERLAAYVDGNTRLVAVSAIQFFTGHRSDLPALGAICHDRGILFAVDAIQAAGHIAIDVQQSHIDILAAGGQKSLMGPPGQGFLYVRDEVAVQAHPTFVGPNAVEDYLHWLKYDMTLLEGASRFAMGTTNWSGIVGLLESVTLLRELGLANIDRYVTALADYTMQRLLDIGCTVVTPSAPEQHVNIVTFRAAPTDEATTAIITGMKARRIFVAKHWDPQDNAYIRVSLHCYNTPADIDTLVDALVSLKTA